MSRRGTALRMILSTMLSISSFVKARLSSRILQSASASSRVRSFYFPQDIAARFPAVRHCLGKAFDGLSRKEQAERVDIALHAADVDAVARRFFRTRQDFSVQQAEVHLKDAERFL